MSLFVTFCNQLDDIPNLARIDGDRIKYIQCGVKSHGYTGITYDDKFIYILYQYEPSGIIILERNSSLFLKQELPELIDPHSAAVIGDRILTVSTEHNCVLEYSLDTNNRRVNYIGKLWTCPGSAPDHDTHHVNSIYVHGNDIYVSAFGPKEGEKWDSARNGRIYCITRDTIIREGIYHPHSVIFNNEHIYNCQSATGTIQIDGNGIIDTGGYVRGMAFDGDVLYAGISVRRRTNSDEQAKILIYRNNQLSGDIKFPHKEIYGIINAD